MELSKYVQFEEDVLKFWNENKIFEKTLEKEAPNGDYTFYDGPPFATGLPHYGHLVASAMKDIVPRYWTMKGYHVDRKWGWDCHGLPIENIVEKEMNLGSKQEILDMGIAEFNTSCRSKVQLYADDWKNIISRFGRWADMENDYKTMDVNFMESIWWVFKTLWDKELIYEGYKSMHVCPRCETTLSNFEVNQNYKDVNDLTAIAKFKLKDEENTYILAWTTTPWTLPGNVALAVGPVINYWKVKVGDEFLILAEDLVEKLFNKEGEGISYEKVAEISGRELAGKKYEPLFTDFLEKPELDQKPIINFENAYQVVLADFVETTEGTGVVHIAPAFGEDDMALGKSEKLPFIQHVKMNGHIVPELKDFADLSVKPNDDLQSTDRKIVEYLESKNLIFSSEEYEHSYPFCWRCQTPLLNYATGSWFVDVPKFKDKLIANNNKVNWKPEHFKAGRFGKWLEGAREWSISRDRFWGNPLPVWKCNVCHKVEVMGSRADLEEKSGEKVDDLHKDKIDGLTWPCDCKDDGTMERIPEVLDCWFESGAMPYASNHYPFENKEEFEKNFPAQFIAEGQDQTRGWFYTLMVLSTALFDKPAFENVVVNGIVLAENGQKMSKSLKNYPDPMEVINQYGSDAIRLYLMSSQVSRAEDLRFAEDGVKEVYRKVIVMLWNVFSFYEMYAGEDVKELSEIKIENILDKWILAKLKSTGDKVTGFLDNYDLMAAGREYGDFINELSTWYVRRSRDRFKLDNGEDKVQALTVLRYVLLETTKLIAPYAPFMADGIYLKLKKDEDVESVHLSSWPELNLDIDNSVLENMEKLRALVEEGLAIRSTNTIKIRQALATVELKDCSLAEEYLSILKDELNIKEIKLVDSFSTGENWVASEKVAMDLEITEELRKEGIGREMLRFINMARKNARLTIHDVASVKYWTEDEFIKNAVSEQDEYLKLNTRSKEINFVDESIKEGVKKVKVNGVEVWIVVG